MEDALSKKLQEKFREVEIKKIFKIFQTYQKSELEHDFNQFSATARDRINTKFNERNILKLTLLIYWLSSLNRLNRLLIST